jgi:hypothetical protein
MLELYKTFGLIAVIIIIAFAIFALVKWPSEKGKSFSEHVAARRSSWLLFSSIFTVVTVLYYLFLFKWLGPHYHLSLSYYGLLVVAFVSQLVLAWQPPKTHTKSDIHTIMAVVVASIMPLLLTDIIITARPLLSILLVVCLIVAILICILLMILYGFVPAARRHYIFYEGSYFICFWAAIILLTYV